MNPDGARYERTGRAYIPPVEHATLPEAPDADSLTRLPWIDGLRGAAAVVMFTQAFADLTWTQSHPGTLPLTTTEGVVRNGQLAISLWFVLSGRSLVNNFYRWAFLGRKILTESAPKKQGESELRWGSLAVSVFRRPIRLAYAGAIVGLTQWLLCAQGFTDDAETASVKLLAPSDLWVPSWCEIGDFAGFLKLVLDMFTNPDHGTMWFQGAQLWTIYDLFWGSMLTYIVASAVAPLPLRSRYLVYAILLPSLWFITSNNFLFIAGLVMCDMYNTGLVRWINDNWKLTMAIELSVMALATALIVGVDNVAAPINNAIGNITVAAGLFGYDAQTLWPQTMVMSNWIIAIATVLWMEVSHTMQWFVGWGIFVWMGKISFGFIFLQYIVLYSIMPPIILSLNDGRSYWNVVAPTYLICFVINAALSWVFYQIVDRFALRMTKAMWNGLFVTHPTSFFTMPYKFVTFLAHFVFTLPVRLAQWVGRKVVGWYKGTTGGLWTLLHWKHVGGLKRTPPGVHMPDDPAIRGQLYSTRWTADLRDDREAMRTYRLLQFNQWSWLIHLWLIPGLTALWIYYHPTGGFTWDGFTFSSLWRFIWALSVPNCLCAYIGFCTPDWSPSKRTMDKRPVIREAIRNFYIVLVTKGSNETAVRRGFDTLVKLEKLHPSVKVYVLTDEPYAYPDISNIVCPKAYKSPQGLAKHKARALDYFRASMGLTEFDWTLHMDEESVTDAESLRRMFDFIRYSPHSIGQGIILYNGHGYFNKGESWKTVIQGWFFSVADCLRVGDDLARFHFQNTAIHAPVFGVHGSFLLLNGIVEQEVTWDCGSLAEDFEFSHFAWRKGFTCGRINGIVREQSPTTLRDFLKQRRRWFVGIREIKGVYGLPKLAINLWIVGVLTLAVTLINIPFSFWVDTSVTPFWIALCADFCFVTFIILYLMGFVFQEIDAATPWYYSIMHLFGMIMQPIASMAEGLAAIWALSSPKTITFEVIVKK
ncbi:glycosyltransferase family 2 protein [Calocera cornea HHB12733]|uniref:Glycosyltransferase family 2 protein n=1 Tax=Calocera cornea HHB12733 TaxID=1353952 RepID=A0A165DK30_9BASI|nr:glycosyltransferase family 2 protein [Calocera cornea HHB12733]